MTEPTAIPSPRACLCAIGCCPIHAQPPEEADAARQRIAQAAPVVHEPTCICPLDTANCHASEHIRLCTCPLGTLTCAAHPKSASVTFTITPEHMPMIRLLLGRHTADTITDDALDALYRELDLTRQQLALSQEGASQRETLLTEARDALEAHGGHGDAWPDIVAPILTLVDRLEQAEAAVQRVRDMHRPWATFYGTHCRACSRLGVVGHTMTGSVIDMPCPTIRALDGKPAAPLTDQPKEQA